LALEMPQALLFPFYYVPLHSSLHLTSRRRKQSILILTNGASPYPEPFSKITATSTSVTSIVLRPLATITIHHDSSSTFASQSTDLKAGHDDSSTRRLRIKP
jgi:hypothetical protein